MRGKLTQDAAVVVMLFAACGTAVFWIKLDTIDIEVLAAFTHHTLVGTR